MQTYQIEGEDGLQAWTVRDLRDVLATMPDDHLVILSSDAEGNEHRSLMEVYATTTDSDYVTMRGHKAGQPCVVLVPMD